MSLGDQLFTDNFGPALQHSDMPPLTSAPGSVVFQDIGMGCLKTSE
ncbi:hypothetical protein [Mycolicibacterium pallens]|uniref:Uncharacterized protein n=1 Tax=Mycolicibacterium pallens TaxID=370524 RepID=A0ABX8VI44_9MYCO|nr:hypothetical protein [Mycolicibacterium pallens]QYL15455.1 hypothetical protein K0O64_20395 [Mycolicibacterium pallens]